MPITIAGSGTITGLSAGGLPAGSVTGATLASGVGGKILQVVSTTKTDTESNSTASEAFWTTGLTRAITPSSTSSKILILGSIMATSSGGKTIACQLVTGNNVVLAAANADTASNRPLCHTSGYNAGSEDIPPMVLNHLHSPNTTSEIIYKVRLHHNSSNTYTLYLNRTSGDTDNALIARYVSTITLMEIAG